MVEVIGVGGSIGAMAMMVGILVRHLVGSAEKYTGNWRRK